MFVALQNAGQTLGAIAPLAPLERGASLRQLEEPFFDCWNYLGGSRYYATAPHLVYGGSSHTPESATTLFERIRVCKQDISQSLERIESLDTRTRVKDLGHDAASAVASMSNLRAEVSHIERSESQQEIARYVSMDALQPLLYHTVLELQIADFLLRELSCSVIQEGSTVEALRAVWTCHRNCRNHLMEAVRAFK